MFKDILLAVDIENPHSWGKSLPMAIELAEKHDARLHLATIVPDFGMSIVGGFFKEGFENKVLEEANKRLHALVKEKVPTSIPVQHIVGHGSIYNEMLRIAEEIKCDLILTTAHRPELKDYLLGPNAARIVRHAQCSVLVIRD